jgi:hypothetical protein
MRYGARHSDTDPLPELVGYSMPRLCYSLRSGSVVVVLVDGLGTGLTQVVGVSRGVTRHGDDLDGRPGVGGAGRVAGDGRLATGAQQNQRDQSDQDENAERGGQQLSGGADEADALGAAVVGDVNDGSHGITPI